MTEDSCGCHGDTERAERDPAYRRALWWVVILNVGFGLFEIVGGFIAGSQALKADALDFLGDGSITFVGLLALAWSERARAKVALVSATELSTVTVNATDALRGSATRSSHLVVTGAPPQRIVTVDESSAVQSPPKTDVRAESPRARPEPG